MSIAVCAVESTSESGLDATGEGWIFIPRPDGLWYRQCATSVMALLAIFAAWSLGPRSAGFFFEGTSTTTTTSTITSSTSSYDEISFTLLCGLRCVLIMLSILLVRTYRALNRERMEVQELGRLCSALWDEQREQKATIQRLVRENRSLSDENAAIQLAFYEMPHGRQNELCDAKTQT